MMKLNDILYGEFEIEPVLSDLLNSAPVQRLKNVHQGGAIFLVNQAINHTRYEHSVGVMYLVKHLGGSMEEQIAALLHDVSHTAFSHVADYIFENTNEDYHESIYEEVIMRSEIPAILKKHGLDKSILFREDYGILEQPLPHLCADRVDYTLRDLFHAGLTGIDNVRRFLSQLILQDGKMALISMEAAEWISNKFTELNNDYFKKPEHVYANIKLAEVLRNAIENGVIKKSDLLKDDFEVLAQLQADPESSRKLEDIKSMARFKQFAVAGASDRFKKARTASRYFVLRLKIVVAYVFAHKNANKHYFLSRWHSYTCKNNCNLFYEPRSESNIYVSGCTTMHATRRPYC